MKNLLTLLTALFIVGLVGCSGSTGPDDAFQGRKIGSFYLSSQTRADYVGTNARPKQKVNSEGVNLIVYSKSNDSTNMFLDANRDYTSFQNTNVQIVYEDYTFHYEDNVTSATFRGLQDTQLVSSTNLSSNDIPDKHLIINTQVKFSCTDSSSAVTNFGHKIEFGVYQADTLSTIVQFRTDSIKKVMKTMFNCD